MDLVCAEVAWLRRVADRVQGLIPGRAQSHVSHLVPGRASDPGLDPGRDPGRDTGLEPVCGLISVFTLCLVAIVNRLSGSRYGLME